MEILRPKSTKETRPNELKKMRLALAGCVISLLISVDCAAAKESQPQPNPEPVPAPNLLPTLKPTLEFSTLVPTAKPRLLPTQESTRTPPPSPTSEPTRTPTPTQSTETLRPTATQTSKPTEKPTLKPQELKFEIGNPETVNLPGITHYPDTHTSFIKDPNGVKVWISAGREGYIVTGNNIENLDSRTTKVIGPSNQETFDRNYAAPSSVILGKNPNELLMFYHGEYYPNQPSTFPFDAGIGIAISQDGGTTWEKKGQILKGMGKKTGANVPFGAGQPSAVIKDNYIYLYYTDWNGQYPDSIHLARAPKDSNGMPGSWEKFNGGRFENKGLDGPSAPVVFPPTGEGYAAIPGVSFNTYLNQFVMVFEARGGFYMSTSLEGIKWSNPTILLKVKTANNNPASGEVWSSYPTLWSPSKANDRETDQNMMLIYSEGKWNQSPHSMIKRPLKLSQK